MLSEKWDVTLGLQKFGKGIWNRNISITSLKEKKKKGKNHLYCHNIIVVAKLMIISITINTK